MAGKKPSIIDMTNDFVTSESNAKNLLYNKTYKTFYLYNNGYYQALDDDDYYKRILKFIEAHHNHSSITPSVVRDVATMSKWKALRERTETVENYICFNDRLLNLKTFETEPHSREKFVTFKVNCDYEETKKEPKHFMNFLRTSLVDRGGKVTDETLVTLAQEMMGMILLDNTKACTAFFMLGSGSNGKTVFSNVIQNMLGDEFYSSMSLRDLADKHSIHSLIGKKANISGEEDENYASSKVFKAVVSGDSIKGEPKFKEAFSFKPKTSLIFMTNKMPTFESLDDGLMRRIVIIPWYRQFLSGDPKKDPFLEDKLKKETAGITGFAIQGARRLIQNRYVFSRSKAVERVIEEFKEAVSSAVSFFRKHFYVCDESKYPVTDMYREYKAWCFDVGKKPKSRANFKTDIMNMHRNLVENRGSFSHAGATINTRFLNVKKKEYEGQNIEYMKGDEINVQQLNF